MSEVNVAGFKFVLHHLYGIALKIEINCLGPWLEINTDALDPGHDGYGFTSTGEAIDNCGLIQGLFISLDQRSLIFAQNSKALDSFLVENPNTVTGYELQHAVIDACINCLGGIINYAPDPVGELIAIKLVLENVKSICFWFCPLLGS